MGVFVLCFFAAVAFGSFFILLSKKWVKALCAILFMLCFGAGMYWMAVDPLSVYLETEMADTYSLIEVKPGDKICSSDSSVYFHTNGIDVQITYTLAEQFEDSTYMFVDEANNKIYYVRENRALIASMGNIAQLNSEEVLSYPAQIIEGDYENVYFEKYVTKSKITFLSLGSGKKVEYKFYIPASN